MKQIFKPQFLTLSTTIFILSGCASLNTDAINETLNGVLGSTETTAALSNEDVISGLKAALDKGTEKAVSLASKEDGFYKNPLLFIPFPSEAQKVKDKMLEIGFDNQVEQFEMTLNRAAENATKEAVPIFLNAIKGMTIQDGFDILNGGENAATNYLKNNTRTQLVNAFSPKVENAINEVELTKYWEPIINKYNLVTILTGGEEINPDLNAYVTDKAIEGLFIHIAKEEENIRENPTARVSDILQKVFGSLD